MILGDTGTHSIKAVAASLLITKPLPLCVHAVRFHVQSKPAVLLLLVLCNQLHSICFDRYQAPRCYNDAFRLHLCGFTCLIYSADVPGPYLCCNLHRQKRYRPSGFRQGFTRWRHVALRGDLFASRAGTAQCCFRFCNQFYPLVGDWPSQLHRVPVSQHVSG